MKRKVIIIVCIGIFTTGLFAFAQKDVLWSYREGKKDSLDITLAHYNRGLYLETTDEKKLAAEHYKQALLITPNFPEARNNLGAVLYDLKRFDDAIVELRQAIQLRPGFVAAHYNLATAYFALNRFSDAAEAYHEAIELLPDFIDAYYFLAQCYNQMGEFNQAVKILERVIELQRDHIYAHYGLANNLFASKKMKRALYHYERVLEIDPTFPEADEIHNMIAEIEALQLK
ncbi:MAG: tetratricopeptide repeat protein [Candidatus Omnitrophica bacterium]|nr:tetratricopeptide repeat protein [Candidatus Omnitrophota bacterium]